MHVDDFIEDYSTDEGASWFLMLRRMPAILQIKFKDYMKDLQLICKFEEEDWYIIGASRLGDVWLSKSGNFPYEKRVDISECSKFILRNLKG